MCSMQPATSEWVEKAEADFITAMREFRARKHPNYDAACFHAQQCAEKYLKAWLQENNISFGKTHDLIRLLSLMPSVQSLEALRPDLAMLTAAAVEFRYPGESATRSNAKEAINTCIALRREIRHLLQRCSD